MLAELFGLDGKVALITGGGSGIGAMMAEGFAAAGARVIICSRNVHRVNGMAEEINARATPGKVEAFPGDVGTEDGIEAIVAAVKSRTGTLNILVNNAGISRGAPLGAFPYSAFEKVMGVNVAGLFHLTQKLLPLLAATATQDDPARVLNLGSVMGKHPLGDGAYSYSASKAAVHHLTAILAKELAAQRVTVNALAPGPFRSRMTAFATGTEEQAAAVGGDVPLGRIGAPSDIQGAALFLCSRAGRYVTGAILPLDGGVHVMTGGNLFAAAMR
ncbi:MAG: SDR family oxidoreductase [Rhodobacteraceae bacterium]|nr:SDR family oxidoreductase [Paracoccaceae bacterium]